jgi:hypothetical protein
VKCPRVSLYIRIRVLQRRYRLVPAVFSRNGTLRAGFALISGNPVFHPEGIYYLRFLRDGMARVGIGEAMIANIAGRDTPLGDVKLV